MKYPVFILTFLALLAVTIWAAFAPYERTTLLYCTKPVIMASLLCYFLWLTRAHQFSVLKGLSIGAIVLSLAGDVMLMLPESSTNFIAGLALFLVAHLLYIFAFLRQKVRLLELSFIKRNPWFLFSTILYAAWIYWEVKDDAKELLGPVIVYIIAITSMLLAAINRQEKVGSKSFNWVAIGALLFVASDSFLAWDKFVVELDFRPLLVLGIYGLAQLFIVSGLAEQILEET